jgi:hypothetical protein
MLFVRLVCWNEDHALKRAQLLESAGVRVDASPLETRGLVAGFREHPPDAVVIDLDRLPSHGRELAVALRTSKSTARLPVVFAGGAPEKVDRIRRELPGAVFVEWNAIGRAVRQAVAEPPANPVRPVPHMLRYAGTPLAKKLGLKPDMAVALTAAPEGFVESLGDLPPGSLMQSRLTARTGLAIWFVRSCRELQGAVEHLQARLPIGASAWIAYPKKSGRYKVDFSENDVRAAGLAEGLVDYKVCAIDADWTGLKFARRRA